MLKKQLHTMQSTSHDFETAMGSKTSKRVGCEARNDRIVSVTIGIPGSTLDGKLCLLPTKHVITTTAKHNSLFCPFRCI